MKKSRPPSIKRSHIALCNGVRGLKCCDYTYMATDIAIALCNGVLGLKYSKLKAMMATEHIALCNGVRGLK